MTPGTKDDQQLPPLEGCTRMGPARDLAAFWQSALPIDTGKTPVLATMPMGTRPNGGFHRRSHTKMATDFARRRSGITVSSVLGAIRAIGRGPSEQIEATALVTAATDKAAYQPDEAIQISAVCGINGQRELTTQKSLGRFVHRHEPSIRLH
ncbi:hypothetical protein [Thermogutta sp.]|jgi:hypothetical protein|uniref:hypothetical protein n=1 Tax=Thermogutta sp. TaxID=1962930 RepID=UPI0032205D3E